MTCPLCSRPVPPPSHPSRPLRRYCCRACSNRAKLAEMHAADMLIDEMAVVRLISGSPVVSTKAERLEATQILTARGYALSEVAERLHTTARTVSRYRAELGQTRKAAA